MRSCTNAPSPLDKEYITQVILKPSDTIFTTVSTQVPKYIYRDTGSLKIAHSIDTVEVVRDYLSKYYYSDTIKGQDAEIVINDTIFKNKISYRQVAVKNLRETKLIDIKKRKLYLGLKLGGNTNQFTALPSVMYQNRKEHIYTYSYDVVNENHLIGTYFKIKL